MSINDMDILLKEASFYIDEWEGTMIARVIEADLDRQDYAALEEHVGEARHMSFDRDYLPE